MCVVLLYIGFVGFAACSEVRLGCCPCWIDLLMLLVLVRLVTVWLRICDLLCRSRCSSFFLRVLI